MEKKIKESFLMKFRKKPSTQLTYDTQIEMFYKFVTEGKKFNNDQELLQSIGFDEVENYFYHIDDKEYKKSTINLKMFVLKDFLDYAVKRQIIKCNYTDTIDSYNATEVREDKKEKYIPTISDIKKMINSTYVFDANRRCEDFNNARDRFLTALLTVTGLRIEEALGIKMQDIDCVGYNEYMVNIDGSRVKNGMDKRVPVPSSIIKYFEEYKLQRMIMNEKFNSDLLFFSYRGKKLDTVGASNIWKKICKKAGIEGNLTSHCFRHFLSNHLQEKGCDMGIIYKILGWRESGIVSVYTRKANDKCFDMAKLQTVNSIFG